MRRKLYLRTALFGALLALVFAGVPTASAHAPKRGPYTCYNYLSGTPIYTGSIRLKKKKKYTALGSPQVGKYRIPKHHRLKFKTGAYAGWRGKYIYWSNGWVIKIIDENGDEVGRCAHD